MAKILMQDSASNPTIPSSGKHVLFSMADGFYIMDPAGNVIKIGSAITLQEADGSPSFPAISTLQVQQSDGFHVTQPVSGVGRIGLNPFTGDTGAGGTGGGVPAPAIGDGAAGKALMANGTWQLPGGGVADNNSLNARLTLISGDPLMSAPVTGANLVYLTPFNGNRISLYSAGAWARVTFSEMVGKLLNTQTGILTNGSGLVSGLIDTSQFIVGMVVSGTGVGAGALISTINSPTSVTLSVVSTASGAQSLSFKMPASTKLDIFAYLSNSVVALEFCCWTSLTARATALACQDGIWVKSSDPTRRYIGTVQTTGNNGETESTPAHPYILNILDYLGSPYFEIPFIIGSRISVPNTGLVGSARIPFRVKLTGHQITADQVGSIVLDVWKNNYDSFPPTSGNSIVGSSNPALSSAQKEYSTSLNGWSVVLEAGDILYININSVTTLTQVEFTLTAEKWFQ